MTTACQEIARRPPRRARREASIGISLAVPGTLAYFLEEMGCRHPAQMVGGQSFGANPRSRRLFVTTNTEEKAIAAPAIIGLSKPATARGIAATL